MIFSMNRRAGEWKLVGSWEGTTNKYYAFLVAGLLTISTRPDGYEWKEHVVGVIAEAKVDLIITIQRQISMLRSWLELCS